MKSTDHKTSARPSLRGPLLFVVIFASLLVYFWDKEDSPEVEIYKLTGRTMGTEFKVVVVSDVDQSKVELLQNKIAQRLVEINKRMSTYDPESELSRFNQSESADWFAVSKETAEVVAYALAIAEKTDGAYDPTVGPLVNLWGFGPNKKTPSIPSPTTVTEAKAKVGYGQIDTRTDPPALLKQNKEIYLDLSSVAKGHGVDAIADLLDEQGFKSYMVEIGGEVRTRGTKPNDDPWRIGIENPDSSSRIASKVLELSEDESIATSGDYRNFFEVDGVKYSHTIDPKSGQPVQHDLATVTVAAELCRDADALATALLVLGPVEGYDWAVEQNVAAYFVRRTDAGPEIITTPAWDDQFPVMTEEE